jgi:hypothetical protein
MKISVFFCVRSTTSSHCLRSAIKHGYIPRHIIKITLHSKKIILDTKFIKNYIVILSLTHMYLCEHLTVNKHIILL